MPKLALVVLLALAAGRLFASRRRASVDRDLTCRRGLGLQGGLGGERPLRHARADRSCDEPRHPPGPAQARPLLPDARLRRALGAQLRAELTRAGGPEDRPRAHRTRRLGSGRRAGRLRPNLGDRVGKRAARGGRAALAAGGETTPRRAEAVGPPRGAGRRLGGLRPVGDLHRPGRPRQGNDREGAHGGAHPGVVRDHARPLGEGGGQRPRPGRPVDAASRRAAFVRRHLGKGTAAADGTLWVPDKEQSVV
jgi:hypothetical protein